MNLDFQRIGEGLLIDQDYWGNLEIELDDKIYKRRKEDNKMKVELESQYEVGDKVSADIEEGEFLKVLKIKFEADERIFMYLLENGLGERNWYEEDRIYEKY